jgi:hypothetical protein
MVALKDTWYNYVDQPDQLKAVEGFETLEHLFSACCSMMSTQLRGCVLDSLTDYRHILLPYKESNAFVGAYSDTNVTQRPLLTINLIVVENDIVMEPSINEIETALQKVADQIAEVLVPVAQQTSGHSIHCCFPGCLQHTTTRAFCVSRAWRPR